MLTGHVGESRLRLRYSRPATSTKQPSASATTPHGRFVHLRNHEEPKTTRHPLARRSDRNATRDGAFANRRDQKSLSLANLIGRVVAFPLELHGDRYRRKMRGCPPNQLKIIDRRKSVCHVNCRFSVPADNSNAALFKKYICITCV